MIGSVALLCVYQALAGLPLASATVLQYLYPTFTALLAWLEKAGFADARMLDISKTTTAEQRSTAWMTFESLQEALDPGDPTRTIEGWPAPRRVIVTALR